MASCNHRDDTSGGIRWKLNNGLKGSPLKGLDVELLDGCATKMPYSSALVAPSVGDCTGAGMPLLRARASASKVDPSGQCARGALSHSSTISATFESGGGTAGEAPMTTLSEGARYD